MFQARVPDRPHGSIVLGRGTAAGLLVAPGGEPALVRDLRVRWLGKSIVDWPASTGIPRSIATPSTARRSSWAIRDCCHEPASSSG